MTKDEALKLALEALEATGIQWPLFKEAITAIRESLAQPEQEPVAWGMMNDDGKIYDCICPEEHDRVEGEYTIPLYTTPPHRKPLTDEEIWKVVDQCKGGRIDFARAIEAAHGIKE